MIVSPSRAHSANVRYISYKNINILDHFIVIIIICNIIII